MPLNDTDLLFEDAGPKSAAKGAWPLLRSEKTLGVFASGLARLLEGGVPLLRSLEILEKQFKKNVLGRILSHIRESIQEGRSLSQALRIQESFPFYFIQMVEAGELSGKLDPILHSLAGHFEKEEERRRKTKEALAYPALVLSLGIVTFFILLKFVIPKIALVHQDLGGELPTLTRMTLALSRWALPLALTGILAGLSFFYLVSRKKELLYSCLLRLPFFGSFQKKIMLARASSLLSLMLQSGIPILQAVDSAGKALGEVHQKDFTHLTQSLSQGESFSEALKDLAWMEEDSLALILSGEESGRLPEALHQIAKDGEREIDANAHFLLKFLEPALIVGIGILVGFIVVSAVLPLLQMNELVR